MPSAAHVVAAVLCVGMLGSIYVFRDRTNETPTLSASATPHERAVFSIDAYMTGHGLTKQRLFEETGKTVEDVASILEHQPGSSALDAINQARQANHNYAYDDGQGHYGYSSELTAQERAQGLATKPYLMFMIVKPQPSDGVYRFSTARLEHQVEFTCAAPCDTVRERLVLGTDTEVVPVVPGTVLWGVTRDVMAGRLTPASNYFY